MLDEMPPEEILQWAWQTFGPEIALSSSFQTQSIPLLHMASRETPEMPVLFLNTGFHFQETLVFRERLENRFGLRVRVLSASVGHEGFRREHGELYRIDPDRCCWINKVQPLIEALSTLRGWVTGIRRDQTKGRRFVPVLSRLDSGVFKICPMVRWTARDVWEYIRDHNLPVHPLHDAGYRSVGCAPCTRPTVAGQDEREGRWEGLDKDECGLHLADAGEDHPK